MNKKFVNHFISIEKVLLAQYNASKTLNHRGLKGKAREFFISKFLNDHIRADVSISNGEIIDCSGGTSSEQDIIIHSKSLPRISVSDSENIVLAESVFASIEIKTKLTSKNEIIECLEKSSATKLMAKQKHYGFYQPTALEQDGKISLSDEIRTGLVVYEPPKIDFFVQTMAEYYSDKKFDKILDFVLLIGKGFLCKVDGLLFEPNLESKTNFAIKEDGRQLMYVYFYLSRLIDRFYGYHYELRGYVE